MFGLVRESRARAAEERLAKLTTKKDRADVMIGRLIEAEREHKAEIRRLTLRFEEVMPEAAAAGVLRHEVGDLREERDRLIRDLHGFTQTALDQLRPPVLVAPGPQPDFAAREETEDDEWDAKFRQSEADLRETRADDHADTISAQAFQAAASALAAAGAPNGNIELFNSDN